MLAHFCHPWSLALSLCLMTQDIMKDTVDNGIKSVTQIPYFEGDFWPNVLEDCAKALDADVDQDRHSSQELASADGPDTEDSSCSSITYSEQLGKVLYSLLLDFCCCFILSYDYFYAAILYAALWVLYILVSFPLSVCLIQAPNMKTKMHRKTKIGLKITQGRRNRCD